MQSIRQEILPPSGVEFATSLKLIPSTVDRLENPTLRQEFTARTLCNVVVARSNLLRIFEVREEPAPVVPQLDEERDRRSRVRKGTEAVEGEVEMDKGGDGFVNIAKSSGQPQTSAPTVTKFYLIREHHLHGTVTGIEAIKTVTSLQDKLDRLLVSFRDAKIALLEWSTAVHDLITVSIHTYERAPQLISLDSTIFRASLRVDPLSRCAALSLPKETFAILPFYQSTLDAVDQETQQMQTRDIPYAPSFLLELPAVIDPNIRHIIDFTFLPGFNKPTVAVLFQTQQTWTGRLKEFKDTVRLIIFSLDIVGQSYPILTSVQGLPYDSISLLPCATSLGGVAIITSNSIIYVDQISRKVALPVNGWASRVSDLPFLPIPPEHQSRDLALEGSKAVFVDDRTMFIVLKDGTVYPVEFVMDGKNISKLSMGTALAQTTIPSIVQRVSDAHLFVGSNVGPSALLKAARVEEEIDEDMDASPTAVVQTNDEMDLDEDEDLYGPSKKTEPTTNGAVQEAAKRTRTVIQLSLCDALPAYGPISDLTFSLAYNGEKAAPELVAATGAGALGGFTLFQRDLPIRTKRKLHAIGGGRGMWSLPIRQQMKSGGVAYERPVQMENDTLILSTDATPSPGLSRIATKNARSDVTITTRIPGMTVGAAAFFQRTAILQVMTNAIRVLEADGAERQVIKDMDGNLPRPKIRACSISDPYVLIFREDDTIGLFIGEAERGKIRRKDMSPMGDKASRYLTGCFYLDSSGFLQENLQSTSPVNGGATTTVQSVTTGNNMQILMLVRPQGTMEFWNLPKLALVFSTPGLPDLQNVLTDSQEPPALSLPQDPPRKPQNLDVEQILLSPLGESLPQPHLFVFLRSGQLAIYQLLAGGQSADAPPAEATRSATLDIKFVKILSKAFEIQRPEESEKSIIAEQKRVLRMFIPFTTSPAVGSTFSGVFFTGDRPSWIIGTDKGGAQLYPSGHNVVHAFTSCSLWDSQGDFLVYSDEGPSLLEWIPDLTLGGPLPLRSVPRGRPYSNVIFDPSTMLVVAASSLQAQFASYDEDGNRVWEPDAPNVADPICDCSTLELIAPDTWITMDGFEFATNEYVNDISIVTLETSSTESGSKDFIAVGTTIDRGEDLAVKGAAYIFEIVEVVPDPSAPVKRWYRLRLRCRDEAKGPVTAVCGFNGYLVSSMGQKVFVRAFDSDERLVGVAFIDVGVYVTSLKTLKNLLLVGDAVKSVMFVAFQEDPYKLVLLGKDINPVCVTSADFFFNDGQLAITTGDEDGVVRLYEYNPHDPESRDGRHLLLRTEYQTQAQYTSSVTVALRLSDDPTIPYAKLIQGSIDGSLASLTPLEEDTFKRLQFLQGQLVRNIQHMAGLNPKAFRIVRNDSVSKPLSKGILDGNLLFHYESLPIPRQDEFTRQIGTDRSTVLKDCLSLGGPW